MVALQEAERLQTATDFPNYNCFLHANSCYDYSWAHVFFGASVIMHHETGGEARCVPELFHQLYALLDGHWEFPGDFA